MERLQPVYELCIDKNALPINWYLLNPVRTVIFHRQLEAIRQEMLREQLVATADAAGFLDDLAANQVSDAVESDVLSLQHSSQCAEDMLLVPPIFA